MTTIIYSVQNWDNSAKAIVVENDTRTQWAVKVFTLPHRIGTPPVKTYDAKTKEGSINAANNLLDRYSPEKG